MLDRPAELGIGDDLPRRFRRRDRHHDQPPVDLLPPVHPRGILLSDITALGEADAVRSEEHTSELQSLMRISYAVFCLKKKNTTNKITHKTKLQHNINNN